MITYAEAVARLAALPLPEPASALVALDEAAGRILAAPVAFHADQPPFDRATMDGYAVALDGGDAFQVIGAVHAGSAFAGTVAPGQAVRIMTGAPVPAGCTVVPVEVTAAEGDRVRVTDACVLAPRRNIAWRGEDAAAGHVVLDAGTRMTPLAIAVAAMAGHREVAVRAAPAVRIIATGDELDAGGAAGIADSNGPFLAAFFSGLGCRTERTRCGDDLARLTAALADAAPLLVTTGGVSAGDRDLVPAAAAAAGFATVLHHVAIQPGKPVFVARHADGRILVGLPGNPVSVVACAQLFAAPLVHRLLGIALPAWTILPLAGPWKGGKRHQFLPAVVGPDGVRPVPWNGSGDLVAAAAGTHLASLPATGPLAAGQPVEVMPYVGGPGGGRLPGERLRR